MEYLPKKKSDVQFNGIKFDGSSWKKHGIDEVQKELNDKFNDIKKQFDELQEEFYWNKLVYESEIRFEPNIGQIYHLYEKENGDKFLSLISPNEWKMDYVGSFKLKYRKWKKVQLNFTKS